jgi:signal transduction histidine kinase
MTLLRTIFVQPLRSQTWRELLYLYVAGAWLMINLLWLVLTLATGVGLALILIGFAVLALVPLTARMFGESHRRLANRLLGENVPAPAQFRPRRGLFGWFRSAFGFVDGWRAFAFLLLSTPVLAVGLWATAVLIPWGFGFLTYPVWWQVADPQNVDANGVLHHSGIQFGEFYMDTWGRALAVSVAGFLLLVAFPWVVRGVLFVERILVRSLLGAGNLSSRVRSLEESRAHAVEDAAETLRRLERDLHDGAQATLVSIAMKLGEAKEYLTAGNLSDADMIRLRELIDSSHLSSKEVVGEIRDVVRNIHPPVLDAGLGPAIETLASRTAIPVSVHVQVEQRPSIVVESIAYFCAAELLTNVVKHSMATRAEVVVSQRDDHLLLTVTDDGKGGARTDAGTGLAGLMNRVATVDGSLHIDSPQGGPTIVHVDLPMRSTT